MCLGGIHMKNRVLRTAAGLFAGVLLISSSETTTYGAAMNLGIDAAAAVVEKEEASVQESDVPLAGISLAFSQTLGEKSEEAVRIAAEEAEQITENETPVVESEYADIAIAQVDNYVNVRAEASTESEVLGKLYNNSAATIL